ncbi:MAG: TonB family protein [Desulfuromonadales bacterium]|nr:TonB family protein [Desulfuromonadales bacterium]
MGRQGTAWISSLLFHTLLMGGIFLLSQTMQQPLKIELVDFNILDSETPVDETLKAPALPVAPPIVQPPQPLKPPQVKIKKVRSKPVKPVAPTPPPPPVAEILTAEPVAVEPAPLVTIVPVATTEPVTVAEPVIPASAAQSSAAPSTTAVAGKASVPKISPSQRYLQARFGYIRKQILKKLVYPQRARRMGWQGQVKIRFVVDPSGQVKDLEVLETSGYPLLDRQALNAVKRAAPFPPPPVAAEISLPITFRLE